LLPEKVAQLILTRTIEREFLILPSREVAVANTRRFDELFEAEARDLAATLSQTVSAVDQNESR
jgi:hypothetical protein